MEALHETCKASLLELAPAINGSLLYCDEGAAQVLQMNAGLSYLLSLGASNVCDLGNAQPGDEYFAVLQGHQVRSISIFLTQMLTDAHQDVLQSIMVHPTVTTIHIFCGLSEHAHACQASTILGVEAYSEYASLLKQDVEEGRQAAATAASQQLPYPADVSITIKHFPLAMCALDSSTFVLPPASAAAQLARGGGLAAGYKGADKAAEDDDGEEGAQKGVSLLAHTLASISSQLNAKPHPFCLGPVSQQLAVELSDLPLPPVSSEPAAAPPTPMAVILVDRSLDLLTPCLHADHPVDCMVALLPRRELGQASGQDDEAVLWRSLDMRVDVPSAYPATSPLQAGERVGASMYHPDDGKAVQWHELLLSRRGKDAAFLVRKWLKEALRQEQLQAPVRSRASAVPPSELSALASTLAANPGTANRHKVIMTLGFAAAEALGGASAQRWEAAGALERQLLMTVVEDPEAAASALLDALANIQQGKGLLSVEDVISVLLEVYSFVGDGSTGPPFNSAVEADLQAALLDALTVADPSTLTFLPKPTQKQVASSTDTILRQQLLQPFITSLFSTLHYAASARQHFKEFRHLSPPSFGIPPMGSVSRTSSSGTSTAPQPLLRILVDKVLQQQQLPELIPPAAGVVRGFLRQGLGRLGFQSTAQSKPADYPLVMVFVVGGLSVAEVREVRAELELHMGSMPRVVLGGTALLAPEDVVARAVS